MVALLPGTRERLIRFYAVYAPDKVNDVDRLLTLFVGKEEATFERLVAKYGPEPPHDTTVVAEAAASPEQQQCHEAPAAGGNRESDTSQPSSPLASGGLVARELMLLPLAPSSSSSLDNEQRDTEYEVGNDSTVAPLANRSGELHVAATATDAHAQSQDRSGDSEECVVVADMYEDDLVDSFTAERAWFSLAGRSTAHHSVASQTSDQGETLLPSASAFAVRPVSYRSLSEVDEAWNAFTRRIEAASSPSGAFRVEGANAPAPTADRSLNLLCVALRLQRVCRGYSERHCLKSVMLWKRRALFERQCDRRCARQRSTVAHLRANTEQLILRCYAAEARQAEHRSREAHWLHVLGVRAQRLEAHRTAKDIAQAERDISRELSHDLKKLHMRRKAADRRTAMDWARLVEASYLEGQQRQRHQAYVEAHRCAVDQMLRSPYNDPFASEDDFALM